MVKFMQDKNLPNIGKSVQSFIKQAQLEAFSQLQGLDNSAVKKRLKTNTKQLLESTVEANF
jgi:hypothetical protein